MPRNAYTTQYSVISTQHFEDRCITAYSPTLEVKMIERSQKLTKTDRCWKQESSKPDSLPQPIIGSVEDITEAKRAEEVLSKSEQRLRTIFNHTFQFIGLLKTDGTLLEANQSLLDFSGQKLEAIVNRPFWEARWWTISSETQEQLKTAIARAAKGEFVRYDVEVLGSGNVVRTIDFSLNPVRDEMGEVVLLIPEGRELRDSEALQHSAERKQVKALLAGQNHILEMIAKGARLPEVLSQLAS
jgi:PAS domain S-box-containing protein